MKKEKNQALIIIIVLVIMSILVSYTNTEVQESKASKIKVEWQKMYVEEATQKLETYNSDTSNTEYYDYEHPLIDEISQKIIEESSNSEEAIKLALDYVYDNVKYKFNEPDSACFAGTAPQIILSGSGQCDTQSIAVISILRKMGIAAKPVGGCIMSNSGCFLQSFVTRQPQLREMSEEDLLKNEFSRGAINSRQGTLHAWAVAWTPNKGWINLEPTAGKYADIACYKYHVEIYPKDQNRKDICVSHNYNYAKACIEGDLQSLNKHGIGLANEVFP